ncbi:uncharacterized protein EV422DRAFT_550008 [Fimicolochytrium jonesii]|uniref:uncharacterized protein n=1 Tax=Fimicolochytrium jonesii TaxID=1396493 RepID=UPI0022FDD0B8|nr:uncharacterized protein EV422DRAFT_550008 [Fimicolochytrium jonesii]KAI8824158.1 hypothetical protein EV422DRAFT_550008 [Fimicolochytrium jonesii]
MLATSGSRGWAYQQELHRESLADPSGFWRKQAEAIDWYEKGEDVLVHDEAKYGQPGYSWYPGWKMNTCYNAVDRHVLAGNGERTALIYDSSVTGNKSRVSYGELLEKVSTLAAVLKSQGIKEGDTIIIYMPMVIETVVAMLACARLGAVHSVVFGGFPPKELAKRIKDCKPRLILTATCGIEPKNRIIRYKPILDAAIVIAGHQPQAMIILQRPQQPESLNPDKGEYDWSQELLKQRNAKVDPVQLSASSPLYLLYTSGSTGVPKGVVRDNGGHAVALHWTMKYIVGLWPGDVLFSAVDVAWVAGHSFAAYGPLLVGATTIIYEGKPTGTPDAGAFWRVIQEYKAVSLFTAPTAIRAIKREDPEGKLIKKYNLGTLRNIFLVGERADPDTVDMYARLLNIPVRENWWQTETGWPMTVACEMPEKSLSSETRLGSAGPPIPGYDIRVLVPTTGGSGHTDEDDQHTSKKLFREAKPNELGTLVAKLPLPPGTFTTLWNNHAGYVKSYFSTFPGYFDTADHGLIEEDGYVCVMGRTDDIINTAGHRLSTGGMEQIVSAHKSVAECAVIGAADQLKGEIPLAFVVLKVGEETKLKPGQIENDLKQAIRGQMGAIACFDKTFIVKRLPKTRSGKVLRRTLRAIADGKKYDIPATIENESVLGEIHALFAGKQQDVAKARL